MARVEVERLTQFAIFTTWADLISDGHVTLDGLKAIRVRVLHSGEFPPSAMRDQLLIMVGDAIGAALGVDGAQLPDSPLDVPDSLEGLDGA